jgi:hypothetical protein
VTSYQKLPIAAKRARDAAQQREPSIACPRCCTHVMPCDLLGHMERCADVAEMPLPHPLCRWLKRDRALALVPSSTLDKWRERGLVRERVDGALLERDVVQLVAWARALGAL